MKINGIEFDFTSFPTHFVKPDSIKLIHHGMASPDRCIHGMIEMMRFADSRFSLDLMLVPTYYIEYYAELESIAKEMNNVRMLPLVPFDKIIPFTSCYDIGIFLVPPTTYNLKMCLPNKFFEFIQARLAIAIGPSPEMARYVKEYDLGVIAKDFTPQSMAEELNKLTKQDILRYKENANKAASLLNAEKEGEKVLAILEKIAG